MGGSEYSDLKTAGFKEPTFLPKRYLGARDEDGCSVLVVDDQVKPNIRVLENRGESTSPTGFEWGYGGSGPYALALSILWDHTGKDPGRRAAMHFKMDVVSQFNRERFELTATEVQAWIDANKAYLLESEDPPRPETKI